MQRLGQIWAVSLLLLTVGAGWAAADPILITTDLRLAGVRAFASDAAGSGFQENTAAANDAIGIGVDVLRTASHAAASATLASSLADPLHLFAEGGAQAISSTDSAESNANAFSRFAIEFIVLTPVTFAFDAFFNVSGDGAASWQVGLLSASNGIFFDGGGESGRSSAHGLLQPGTYLFTVAAIADSASIPDNPFSSNISHNLALDFADAAAPIPEPASMMLVASGLVAAAVRRRRARRDAA
jgi:hypothetical protein